MGRMTYHRPVNQIQRERVRGYCCAGHSGSKRARTRAAKRRLKDAFRRAVRREDW